MKCSKEYQRKNTARYRKRHEVWKSLEKYKGIEGVNYVECKICKKRSLYIDIRHLRTRHSLTKEEYIRKFPDAYITSEKKKQAQSRPNNKGNSGKKFCDSHRLKITLSKLGNKNPSWKGGTSLETYCKFWSFKEFKEFIKERDGHRCWNPSCSKTCNRMSVHHIDYNKKNCNLVNLITLCMSCNAKANFKRKFWKKFYKMIMYMRTI